MGRIGAHFQIQETLPLHLVKPTQQHVMAFISLLQEAAMLAKFIRSATMMSGALIQLACDGPRCPLMQFHGFLVKVTLPTLFEGRCLSLGAVK
jgi:hypothetical protein